MGMAISNWRSRNVLVATGAFVALLTVSLLAQVVGPYTILPSLHVQQAGNAGAPSIGPLSSATTGFYFPSALVIGESGTILPGVDATYDLGGVSNRFRNLYVSGSLSGVTVQFGDGSVGSPSITFASATGVGFYRTPGAINLVGANFIPGFDGAYSLGSSANRFGGGYFTQTVTADVFQVGAGDPSTANVKQFVTAAAGILNIPYLNFQSGDGTVAVGLATALIDAEAIQVDPSYGDAQPACNADARGTIWYLYGASGVADQLQICGKAADGSYAWVTIE